MEQWNVRSQGWEKMVRGPGIGRGPGMMGEGDGVAKGEGGGLR